MSDSAPGRAETTADDEAPLDLEGMLALAEDQRLAVDSLHLRPIAWLYSIWGVAWFVGYLLLWSAFDGGNPWFRVQAEMAWPVFGILIAASIVSSIIIGSRMGRGVRGVSSFQGAVYGWSWMGLSTAFGALGIALANYDVGPVGTGAAGLYFPSAYAIMAGSMYLLGAAIWRNRGQLVLAVVLLIAGTIAPFLGTPGNYAVMAGAGLAFSVMAVLTIRFLRRVGGTSAARASGTARAGGVVPKRSGRDG